MVVNQNLITNITSYNNSPLTLNSGLVVERYNSVWSAWNVINDQYLFAISDGNIISFTFDNPIIANNFSLYINGINQLTSTYTLNSIYPNVVTLNIVIPVGQKVTGLLKKYTPTTSQLSFDPIISDVPSMMTQYKYDYQYVVQPVRDFSGQISGNTYYFWVQNKSIASKTISCQQAVSLLQNGPNMFMTFQDMRIFQANSYLDFYNSNYYSTIGLINSTMKYKAITIANLNNFVNISNSFKLRFTKDFTLQDNPNEIDLKNVHTEWQLIRPNSLIKIPQSTWDKLVDSACGHDLLGNTIPSSERIQYDNRHGTFTRYGFASDQILFDNELIIPSLTQAILNPSTTKWVNGAYVPDMINNINYSLSSSWFISPESTRQFLDYIWNNASIPQINGIFFAVLDDALSTNYEFTDMFKTSLLSSHSITTIN
jgi:hypothetical protein